MPTVLPEPEQHDPRDDPNACKRNQFVDLVRWTLSRPTRSAWALAHLIVILAAFVALAAIAGPGVLATLASGVVGGGLGWGGATLARRHPRSA
jgi:hypothetical protein